MHSDTVNRSYPGSTLYRLISYSLSAECTFLCSCIPHIDILYFRIFDLISSMFCSTLSTYLTDRVCTLKFGIFRYFLQCNNFALASLHVSISTFPVLFKGRRHNSLWICVVYLNDLAFTRWKYRICSCCCIHTFYIHC